MKVTLKLPETLPSQAFDLSIYVASKLYGDGLLSAGQASQMTGLSKRAFIEIMGKYGVSAFSESLDDLTNDLNNARDRHVLQPHTHPLTPCQQNQGGQFAGIGNQFRGLTITIPQAAP